MRPNESFRLLGTGDLEDGQAEHLGSCEIENQLEFHGVFHGQIGGLGTLEDLVHVRCSSDNKFTIFFTALLQHFYDSR